MNKAWLVLQTKPRKEYQVYRDLCANAVEVYYPALTVKPVNPRASRIQPFFPRYMFVYLDAANVSGGLLRWLPGTIGFVQFGDDLATVSDTFIDTLKHRVHHIQASGGFLFDDLKQGDTVRILQGSFAGYDAIFDLRLSGTERVQLLLNMAGQAARISVEAGNIEKCKQ